MSDTTPRNEGPVLPVGALILSMVGLCFPPLLLISGGLGLYGFLRARKDPVWAPRKQVTQMTMAVSVAGLLIFTGLAIPNYKQYLIRSKQFECRSQLAGLYEAQREFYAKNKRYTTKLTELVPAPVRGSHLIRLSAEGPLWTEGLPGAEFEGMGFDEQANPTLKTSAVDAAIPKLVRFEVGLKGECPACSVTMLCASELDGDETADVWTVSTIERLGGNGGHIAGGFPWNESDDVTQ
jgi:type IV pilus assembly protein PilA